MNADRSARAAALKRASEPPVLTCALCWRPILPGEHYYMKWHAAVKQYHLRHQIPGDSFNGCKHPWFVRRGDSFVTVKGRKLSVPAEGLEVVGKP